MSAAALVRGTPFNGLRPVNLRTDLAGMAELIELCFGPTMDEGGRAAVREMRMISQSGSLTLLFHGLDRLLGGLEQGFVWIEEGRLVGNVSVSPANYPRSMGTGFVIANVAVHPDFRRRGLALAMMQASLDLIRQRGANFAVLQVDANNDGARRLYQRLGFHEERTFIRWHHSSHARTPQRLLQMPNITLRQPNEWQSELHLAQSVRPNDRGGLSWLRPTHPNYFQPSLLRTLAAWTTGRNEEHWIVRGEGGRGIVGVMHVSMAFGSADRLELLVDPRYQSQLTDALINFTLRRLEGRRHPVTMEHPADDETATSVLERYAFERRYTLVHMRYNF